MAGLEDSLHDPACAEAFSDRALIAAMLRFESALAAAWAATGAADREAARVVKNACDDLTIDPAVLAAQARVAGTLAIPLVATLTARVQQVSPGATRWVHAGATSQDLIDTATVLCIGEAGARIVALTRRLGDAMASTAERHAGTPMLSRTLLQPAAPVPFGWKAATWLDGLLRGRASFSRALDDALVLQFGGPSGTLAALGDSGASLTDELARQTGLKAPAISWHATRDRFARLGAEASILAGLAGKIARDVSLLMQFELAEVAEPTAQGRGGSSAMPHKRNPTGCTTALEAAQRAPLLAATLLSQMTPELERGLGQWQAQWLTLRELFGTCGAALAAMADVIEGLVVNEQAMLGNIGRTSGWSSSESLAMELGATVGRERAHALLAALARKSAADGLTVQEAIAADPEISALLPSEQLTRICDPVGGFASARRGIARTVAAWRAAAD